MVPRICYITVIKNIKKMNYKIASTIADNDNHGNYEVELKETGGMEGRQA